jgi:hypothetical protein
MHLMLHMGIFCLQVAVIITLSTGRTHGYLAHQGQGAQGPDPSGSAYEMMQQLHT